MQGWTSQGQTIIKEWTKSAPAVEAVRRKARERRGAVAHEEAVKAMALDGEFIDQATQFNTQEDALAVRRRRCACRL